MKKRRTLDLCARIGKWVCVEFMQGKRKGEERERERNWIGGERIEQQDRAKECLSAKERKLLTQTTWHTYVCVSLSICDLRKCNVVGDCAIKCDFFFSLFFDTLTM